MAQVMNMADYSLDRRRDRKDNVKDSNSAPRSSPPPHPTRRPERDSRERRDNRDLDRPPNRRGADYYDMNRSPLMLRDYKRRGTVSPRRLPPYKRSRWDDGGYEPRRGSPLGGFGPDKREGLKSYKQFIQELDDDILPAEVECRYQEYKLEYISAQKKVFFNGHKDEEWLKEKYHPTNLLAVMERRNDLARKEANNFFLDLQSGTLDLGLGVNDSSSNKSGQASDPNSDDEVNNGGKRRRHDRGPAKETDFFSAATKVHPISSEPRRFLVDIEQAQALVLRLDSEKGIKENILCGSDNDKMNLEKSHSGSTVPVINIQGSTSVKGLEGVELLDTLINYLWRIHGVDYYGMVETSVAKGLRHMRAEGKSSDITSNGAEWESKLDSRWQERLRSRDPLEIMTAKDKIDASAVDALDPFIRKIRDEKYGWKYGCGAKSCTKLFHASEFVHKHLKLKHPELVMKLTSNVREELYFQNYMNDPDAPGGTPVMQQPMPKGRPLRCKLGSDNRLKDECGNHREGDYRANGSDRFENTQSSDFPSNNDGADGANHDKSMFDTLRGQGICVAPSFPSAIPPPRVLMPVPGAGPLGPFVPAPPEVAMRMIREQGGPPPFEGSGRHGRPEPQICGPVPIPLFPAFRQNPRRIRSYQDRDAPKDEVTVIDYRSL